MLVAWGRKLERSPFLVDQVAESERIDEEHRVKLLEEARRMQRFDARKKVIKKEIILRVLAESNAIETLRSEKRYGVMWCFRKFDHQRWSCTVAPCFAFGYFASDARPSSPRRLIHLEEMRLKAKQDLLRREISKETDATDRGRFVFCC
jgi:hypothetical protein